MLSNNIFWGEYSSKGCRQDNQDVCLSILNDNIAVFAVADGMGGYSMGEKIAWIIIDALRTEFDTCDIFTAEYIALLLDAKYDQINKYIYETTKASSITGGSTISTLCLTKDKCIAANIGDTRISRIRGNEIVNLSKIHNVAAQELAEGKITYSQYKKHDKKNLLTQCIGIGIAINPHICIAQLVNNDIYFICSDGVYNFLEDQDFIEEFNKKNISSNNQMEETCKNLVAMAYNNGSNDNLSITAIKISSISFNSQEV